MGKTTTLKSIVGWQKPRTGSVTLDGEELVGRDMMTIARKGVSLVPEERRIFTNLTVAENLKLAQVTRSVVARMLRDALLEKARQHLQDGNVAGYAAEVAEHKRDPYTLVEEIVNRIGKS